MHIVVHGVAQTIVHIEFTGCCVAVGRGAIPGSESGTMTGRPKKGFVNVILVWMIGLTLGVAAGAVTAMLLLPDSDTTETPNSVADLFRH